ncbi:hypothetical protein GCM10009682_14230 [Luedemannella flava]|uniref:Uncharacterized protein n=1 Tax=Luedemannella flava TaxID=349316 RepID=A0ABN2LM58_9ACTN
MERQRTKAVGVVSAAATVVLLFTGFVADVLGIRSALVSDEEPTREVTVTYVPPPSVAITTDTPIVHEPPVVTRAAVTTTAIETTAAAPPCIVGSWLLNYYRLDETVTGVGTVRMSLVQGGQLVTFRADGTFHGTADLTLEGRASTGDLLARRIAGSGRGDYTVSGDALSQTGVTSSGTNVFYRNHVVTNQINGPIWVDWSVTYTCSATTLTIDGDDQYARYTRQ